MRFIVSWLYFVNTQTMSEMYSFAAFLLLVPFPFSLGLFFLLLLYSKLLFAAGLEYHHLLVLAFPFLILLTGMVS
ncbi:hypothetical protein GGI35DRAFT_445152 [Trichoderma velutinum]